MFVISSIKAGESLTVVSVGNAPGTAVEHAEGAVVAMLRAVVVTDCDWTGLGGSGTSIAAEDENVFSRVLARGNTLASPPTPQKITLPESGKAFQIVQKGQDGILAVEGGAVTAAEWSADGKTFFKLATATNVTFHVSTGDFVKLIWTTEPTVNFVADRV